MCEWTRLFKSVTEIMGIKATRTKTGWGIEFAGYVLNFSVHKLCHEKAVPATSDHLRVKLGLILEVANNGTCMFV